MIRYAIREYGSRVPNQGFSSVVAGVSAVDLARSRSTLTSEGCTVLYIVSGRVRGDANASREREDSGRVELPYSVPGRLLATVEGRVVPREVGDARRDRGGATAGDAADGAGAADVRERVRVHAGHAQGHRGTSRESGRGCSSSVWRRW